MAGCPLVNTEKDRRVISRSFSYWGPALGQRVPVGALGGEGVHGCFMEGAVSLSHVKEGGVAEKRVRLSGIGIGYIPLIPS